jgi:hypothetical protein
MLEEFVVGVEDLATARKTREGDRHLSRQRNVGQLRGSARREQELIERSSWQHG